MLIPTTFAVLFQVVVASAAINPCTEVHLPALQYLPVPNQGNVNTCYAYVGAEMVDLWRFSHSKAEGGDTNYRHLTSALGTVLSHRAVNSSTEDSIDWGRACEPVDEVREHGSCDAGAIDAAFKDTQLRSKLGTLQLFYNNFKKAPRSTQQDVAESLDRYLRVELKVADALVPRQDELEKLLRADRLMPFLYGVIAPGCTEQNRQSVKGLPRCNSQRQMRAGAPYYEKTIQAALDRKVPEPVGVSLCSQVLKKGRAFVGVTGGVANPDCRKHVVLVVGRRLRNTAHGAKCQFRVRNSWGADYPKYSNDWQPENGDVWVDVDALTANTYGVAWLD